MPRRWVTSRSEEHTSELQSQSNLVCRLLLEKKKTEGTARRTSFTRHSRFLRALPRFLSSSATQSWISPSGCEFNTPTTSCCRQQSPHRIPIQRLRSLSPCAVLRCTAARLSDRHPGVTPQTGTP